MEQENKNSLGIVTFYDRKNGIFSQNADTGELLVEKVLGVVIFKIRYGGKTYAVSKFPIEKGWYRIDVPLSTLYFRFADLEELRAKFEKQE